MTITRRELIDYYARRLTRSKWNWLGTLMFRRRSLPFWMADRIFDNWIFEMERGDDGDNYVSWFRMKESRGFETKPRFYVLVGGSWHGSRYLLMDRWHEMAGDSEITRISSSVDVFEFITEKACLSRTFDINWDS